LSKTDSVRLYKVRKLISELSNKEGRGTELVSLYIPPKKPIHEAIANLRDEWGTAGNIKSDTTRNHVQDALTKTMQRLKLYRTAPDTGLVIFSGALPTNGPGSEIVNVYEIVPPKPVTQYLYQCLGPDTRVLLQDGGFATMGELKGSWHSQSLMSYDFGEKSLVGSKVERYVSTSPGLRACYKLTAESGRTILATEDHPFWTPRGWVRLGEIASGDLVAIVPVADLDRGASTGAGSSKIILDEDSLRQVPDPPKNFDLAVCKLKRWGLLPLNDDNPKLLAVARILGHLCSNGALTRNVEQRKSGTYVHYTMDSSLGTRTDEDALRKDFSDLGYTPPKGRETEYDMNVEGRRYKGRVIHVKIRNTALITLLRALGAPVGRKVEKGTAIPAWLQVSSRAIKREFLAAYLGGDGEAPRIRKTNLSSGVRLSFHRIKELEVGGLEFAGQLRQMLKEFGVATADVTSTLGCTKKGLETVQVQLRLDLSEKSVLKLCHAVGFRYSVTKKTKADLVGEYLRIKHRLREEATAKVARARELSTGGASIAQISNLLSLVPETARQWAQGSVETPLVTSDQLPVFEEWLKSAKSDLEDPLVWETVVSKSRAELVDVRDLTVEGENHSFVANGFLVHNCDDHFHVEWLKDMLKEEKVYGILSIDSSEVGMGILSGDRLEIVDVLTSGISGKTRKGGQCVSADTLVQLEDGRLVPVSRVSPRTRIGSYNFDTFTHGLYECTDTFVRVPRDYYVIETTRPMFRISVTGEHRFFTLSPTGEVSTVEASELGPGDRLLISRRLNEPTQPSLSTMFPANYTYLVTMEGRRILKEIRLRKKLSQEGLARAVGLHQTEISQLERGERNLIAEKLEAVVECLFGDFSEFVEGRADARRSLPEFFTPELLQLLGYMAGDANADVNRINLYEERKHVAEIYARLAKSALNLECVPARRVHKKQSFGSSAKKHCYETRIYFKEFVDAIRQFYPGLISTGSREIPEEIHRLDNAHLARFLRGLFDAEANVRKRRRIGIDMKSGLLIRQLQLLLLRFGIVSSYKTHVNRFGTLMHGLDISDHDSLVQFRDNIGFTAPDKVRRLENGIRGRRPRDYHSVPVVGSWIDGIAKELDIRRRRLSGITNFSQNQRGISSGVFERVIDTFEANLAFEKSSGGSSGERLQLLEDTVFRLNKLARSDLIFVTVKRVQRVQNRKKGRFVDIELPSTRSFVGGGFVLHNSARRYERGREMELTYYFNRVGEHATRVFMENNKVTGLIVGGPGPTKDEFLKGEYLNYELQKKVLAVLDLGYSGREGVRELVEKAGDILKDVRLVEEKRLVQKFLAEVNRQEGLAVYGLPRVIEALQKASADVVLVSDDLDMVRIDAGCKKCGTVKSETIAASKKIQQRQEMASTPCSKCGATDYDVTERDLVDVLEEMAFQVGSKIEVISSGTEEGNMFKSFGGVAAILRYRS
jgi:peptide subunit release factor 1 (eRF1)/intein/homing endonuclease